MRSRKTDLFVFGVDPVERPTNSDHVDLGFFNPVQAATVVIQGLSQCLLSGVFPGLPAVNCKLL